jgi:hypothetical protein
MHTSAISQTFSTAELIELIITYLPPRDILTNAQRVCKAWHTIISTSPTLQTALYFRAAPLSPSSFTTPHPLIIENFTLNPFITSAFHFLLTPNKEYTKEEDVAWNRKLARMDPTYKENDQYWKTPYRKLFTYSEWATKDRADAWRRKEASWRRMLVSSPPVKRLVLREQSCSGMVEVTREGVVRFGEATTSAAATEIPNNMDDEDRVEKNPGPREKVKNGWVKTNGAKLDLQNEDGLRMAPLYDYLYTACCTGENPNQLDLVFFPRWPIDRHNAMNVPEDPSYRHQHYPQLLQLGSQDQELDDRHMDAAWERDGYDQGVTLFLRKCRRDTCDSEEGETFENEKFRSQGLARVVNGRGEVVDEVCFGPMEEVRSRMDDYDRLR